MTEASKQGLSCHPMSTPIGYGCSGLGNLYEVIPDAIADATLAEAWRAGYRYFDTSPFYGFGLSELRVGRFLRSVPRQDFILSTKVGRYMTPLRGQPQEKLHWAGPLELRPVFDYSYDGIMRSIEQSIVRLPVRRSEHSRRDRHSGAALRRWGRRSIRPAPTQLLGRRSLTLYSDRRKFSP